MEIITAKNVVAYTTQPDSLDMEVAFEHLSGQFIHFTACKDDPEEHGRELYSRAMFGEFGHIEVITPPSPPEAEQQARLNALLKQAATVMGPLEDAESLGIISDSEREQLTSWRRYRVALYRLPQCEGWPTAINWPEPPPSPF